jgi:hypothetical protein
LPPQSTQLLALSRIALAPVQLEPGQHGWPRLPQGTPASSILAASTASANRPPLPVAVPPAPLLPLLPVAAPPEPVAAPPGTGCSAAGSVSPPDPVAAPGSGILATASVAAPPLAVLKTGELASSELHAARLAGDNE